MQRMERILLHFFESLFQGAHSMQNQSMQALFVQNNSEKSLRGQKGSISYPFVCIKKCVKALLVTLGLLQQLKRVTTLRMARFIICFGFLVSKAS